MTRFHLTPQGPKLCRASKRPCRYGSSEHYPMREATQVALEAQEEARGTAFSTLRQERKESTSQELHLYSDGAGRHLFQRDDAGQVKYFPVGELTSEHALEKLLALDEHSSFQCGDCTLLAGELAQATGGKLLSVHSSQGDLERHEEENLAPPGGAPA